ncbi:Uncharacterised protein [Streptococcus pneumoniae]|nr:Uncharacterised protein [Streptococcus pneumoniae]
MMQNNLLLAPNDRHLHSYLYIYVKEYVLAHELNQNFDVQMIYSFPTQYKVFPILTMRYKHQLGH